MWCICMCLVQDRQNCNVDSCKLHPGPPCFIPTGGRRVFDSLSASGKFCHLLINVANILEPDHARQSVVPDLDPNCLHPDGIPKCFLKKLFFKKSADEKNHEKYRACKCFI